MEETNYIKQISKQYGISYVQMAAEVGYGVDSLRKAASTGVISEPIRRAIELYAENMELKKQLAASDQIKKTIKSWIQD